MALRWLVLACLVSLAIAQQTDATDATDAPTMAPETMAPETMAPETMAPETMAPETMAPETMAPETMAPETMPTVMPTVGTPSPIEAAQANMTVEERYVLPQANAVRQEHFFCPTQGGSFTVDTFGADMRRTANVWSLFLQYPVLAYLDSIKKQALIGQVVALLNAGGQPSITTANICIGRVFHYDVSLYTESVLINIYLEGLTPTIPVEDINRAFELGVSRSPSIIRSFQGRDAIIISNSTYGMIQQNVHPGAFRDGQRFEQVDDPTLNAVILGSWARQYSLDELAMDAEVNSTIIFAANPNPVFYGLTGGDIVFIIIATGLCALLAFLMVFGFCIQPFFM